MTACKSWERGRDIKGLRLSRISAAPKISSLLRRPQKSPCLLPAGTGLARPLRRGRFRLGLASAAPSRPLPPPPETGSAQTMAWNAPL